MIKWLLIEIKQSHVFGPRETITIDLQAEISYEDFTTLNNFINAKDGESEKYLASVAVIISELLHIVVPHQSVGAFENLKDMFLLNMSTLRTFKVNLNGKLT